MVTDERRLDERYPIARDLTFVMRVRGSRELTGNGTSVNLSRRGLLLRSHSLLIPGQLIRVVIDWGLTSERSGTSLVLQGHVAWSKPPYTAVSVTRYTFVPCGADHPIQAAPEVPLDCKLLQ